jgi:hypothetical protein
MIIFDGFLIINLYSLPYVQVECKKAQPKEVMMPNNVARGRGAGRGAYGKYLLIMDNY